MRRLITVILTLGLGAGVVWAQDAEPRTTPKKPAPRQAAKAADAEKTIPTGRGSLFVKENVWDFGYVGQNSKITHAFVLENVGDDTLFLERIKPT